MGEMSSRRRHARSSAAGPLDDDDLLCEIFLRLSPQPSSLPRASVVCKRWRRLVSDPGFFRRFRLRHRRNPPLLGFFDGFHDLSFLPTLEAPNRIPPGRFSLPPDDGDRFQFHPLGCRHGLLLIRNLKLLQVLVWDPVTGDQHRIAIPAAFDAKDTWVNGAVLRSSGDVQHFQVVLAAADGDDEQHIQARACVYSSRTGSWGHLISTPIPYQAYGGSTPTTFCAIEALLAGDSLYWLLAGNLVGILEFDLAKQSLAVIRVPVDMFKGRRFKMVRAEGGGLGLFLVSHSNCTAQLWKWKNGRDGVASWVLVRIIKLDKLLSLKSEEERPLVILGFAEENNVVLLWTKISLFTIHLESLKIKKLFKTNIITYYHPFESVYTAGACVGGVHDGAELLLNT